MTSSPFKNKELLEQACSSSTSMSEAICKLGLRAAGANFKRLKEACLEFSIDVPQYDTSKYNFKNILPLEDVLIENSTYKRSNLKRRLISNSYLEYKCHGKNCEITKEWLGSPISLQLEHINGIFNDNRLENLTLLCPNCHSQTATFAGKKNKVPKEKGYVPREHKRKVVRPNKEDLEKLVWERPTSHLAKDFGISDKAIGEWCRVYGISKPPRGYWSKFKKE